MTRFLKFADGHTCRHDGREVTVFYLSSSQKFEPSFRGVLDIDVNITKTSENTKRSKTKRNTKKNKDEKTTFPFVIDITAMKEDEHTTNDPAVSKYLVNNTLSFPNCPNSLPTSKLQVIGHA